MLIMINNGPFFSILIPNLGVNNTLFKCFSSIVNQKTNGLFEYEIIVLDQSDSEDFEKIQSIIKKHNFNSIQLLHTNVKHLLKARHALMQQAKGQYICFIDSDDFVCEEYLLSIFRSLENNNFPDVLIHTYKIQYPQKEEFKIPTYPNDIKDNVMDYFFFSNYLNSIIAKTFRKDLYELEDYKDFDTVIGEDWVFSFPIMNKSQKTFFDKDIDGYYYVQNSNSITHTFTLENGIKTLFYRDSYFEINNLNKRQIELFSVNKLTAFCNSLIPCVRNKTLLFKDFAFITKKIRNILINEYGFRKGKILHKRNKIVFYLIKLKFYRLLYLFFKI